MKIIDFAWHLKSLTTTTVGYPSDSGFFCIDCCNTAYATPLYSNHRGRMLS